jgi:hypothetical protein
MNATKTWPPGYRALADLVQEHGRDTAQARLLSGQWSAFRLDFSNGNLEPIPVTTWCIARGRMWLEDGAEWIEPLPGEKFGLTQYAVVVALESQPPKQRKSPQADRTDQAIAKRFPRGTDGIATKAVHKAVAEELAADSTERGIPSLTTVKRRLGRRK